MIVELLSKPDRFYGSSLELLFVIRIVAPHSLSSSFPSSKRRERKKVVDLGESVELTYPCSGTRAAYAE